MDHRYAPRNKAERAYIAYWIYYFGLKHDDPEKWKQESDKGVLLHNKYFTGIADDRIGKLKEFWHGLWKHIYGDILPFFD